MRSLLEAVGTVSDRHDGKVEITVEDETMVLEPPHGKDVDKDTIVDLRHLLSRAGIT